MSFMDKGMQGFFNSDDFGIICQYLLGGYGIPFKISELSMKKSFYNLGARSLLKYIVFNFRDPCLTGAV